MSNDTSSEVVSAVNPHRWEFVAVIAYLMIFCVLATIVVSHGRQHADSIMDADPAINLVLGQGCVTFVHPHVPPGSSTTNVAPTYTYLLAAWLMLGGISCPTVMSMNVVLVASSTFLLWLFTARSRLIRSPWLRLTLAAGLPLIPPVFLIYKINRYDSLGMLGLAVATATLTVRNRIGRIVLLVGSGFFIGTAGFHVIIGGGLLTVLAWWLLGRRAVVDFLSVNAGIAGGLCFVVVRLIAGDLLDDLQAGLAMDGVTIRHSIGWHLLSPIRGGQLTNLLDEDFLLVLAASIAVVAATAGYSSGRVRTAGVFGLVAATAVPFALSGFGRYSATYVWLAAIPMFVSCVIVIDHEVRSRITAAIIASLLAASIFAGFPAHALMLASEWTPQDRRTAERWIKGHIKADDVVYASIVGYYPAKLLPHAAYIGSAFHSLTDEQKSSITLLVVDGYENGRAMKEPTADEAMAAFGGSWSIVHELTIPRGTLRTMIPPKPKSDCTYHITIYRKQSP